MSSIPKSVGNSFRQLARTLSKNSFPLGAEGTDPNTLIIEDTEGKYEVKELNDNHVVVRNLVGNTFYLDGSPKSLHISRLTNCKLICGPVLTSVLVEECRNCVLFICCKQFRANSSEYLDVYLRVESKAIISDSSKIRFAPYKWNHEKSAELHRLAEFDSTEERFDLIDDFDWLAFSTPSPNWEIIPDEERKLFPDPELPEKEEVSMTPGGAGYQDSEIQFADPGGDTGKKKLGRTSSIPMY
jgi:hypothetical protein